MNAVLRYLINRLSQAVLVLIAITLLAFLVFYFDPADPVNMFTRDNPSPEYAEKVRARLGLDKPPHVQYLLFVERLVQGDLGFSYRSRQPVVAHLVPAALATLKLTLVVLLFTVLIGVPAGILSATRPYSLADNVVMSGVLVGVSAPNFWIGILLIWVFALQLGWLPPSGSFSWNSVILPAFTLALSDGAIVARITRTSMLEVLQQDYIRTARAKGLRQRMVLYKHALRNASLPIVTIIGLHMASMLGGTITLENVFAWPGLGRMLVVAILERDAPIVQGCVVLIAVAVLVLNFLTDVIYVWLNPTVKFQ